MVAHLTEEEQIEAFKRWWNEHGTKTVLLAVTLSAAYFGWNWYGDQKLKKAQQASVIYQEFVEANTTAQGVALTDAQKEKMKTVADKLSASHANSVYNHLINLQLAKLAVDEKDYEKAAEVLQSVLSADLDESIKNLATLRFARVLFAQGKYDEAIAKTTSLSATSFGSVASELRGDIYMAQNRLIDADIAYREAMSNVEPSQAAFMRNSILQYKLNNTKVATQSPENPLEIIPNPHGATEAEEAEVEVETIAESTDASGDA